MEGFKKIEKEKLLENVGISIPEWRHNFVYGITGSLYSCGGGIIHIKFSEDYTREVKSKNTAKTLDNIIYQLMAPLYVKRTTKWIEKILEGRRPYTVEEIEKLKIWVTLDVNTIDWKDEIKKYPRSAGVYVMTFPNGKKYLGQTVNFQERIESHFSGLFGNRKSEVMAWYSDCLKENPQLKPRDIQIECIPTGSRKILEKEMLSQIENRAAYYNLYYQVFEL